MGAPLYATPAPLYGTTAVATPFVAVRGTLQHQAFAAYGKRAGSTTASSPQILNARLLLCHSTVPGPGPQSCSRKEDSAGPVALLRVGAITKRLKAFECTAACAGTLAGTTMDTSHSRRAVTLFRISGSAYVMLAGVILYANDGA